MPANYKCHNKNLSRRKIIVYQFGKTKILEEFNGFQKTKMFDSLLIFERFTRIFQKKFSLKKILNIF